MEASTKQAIQLLQEKGIHLVAATGRPLSMCYELKELGIETFITANGAYVKHKDLVLHKTLLPKILSKMYRPFHRNSGIA